MRFVLGFLVLILNAMDNTTTFFCLNTSVPGFEVTEANPIARWLFDSLGLVEGLLLEGLITAAAVSFLVLSHRIPHRARLAVLTVLTLLPAWATLNNLFVMQALGIEL